MTTRDFEPASDARQESAANRLLAALAYDLELEERALEAPGFDELARAAEGELDAGEEALWAERVARDRALAGRERELAEFVAEAYSPAASGERLVLPFPAQKTPRAAGARPTIGWLAAAAAALGAIGLSFVLSRPAAVEPSEALRVPPPAAAAEPLFVDGFEGGDVTSWSSIASSG